MKVSSSYFAHASFAFSLLFCSGSGAPKLDLLGVRWIAIQALGLVLGVVAAVLNFRKKPMDSGCCTCSRDILLCHVRHRFVMSHQLI
jgi:hypothetical protein